ncbi:MAG TPA: dTDP-4-dehydrorhamnose 3,5-epimerase, partial [Crocinitomicaceae bacterium]|nr:dTDP-4-dehydrorhamnose 3,5-epimerase [Crocinitomicaceae bacterium]
IRKNSPTYGKHIAVELSAENGLQFWIPEGFAHGFSVLEDNTLFSYKCTNYYQPSAEMGIHFGDAALGIDWQVENLIVNQKDDILPILTNFVTPF